MDQLKFMTRDMEAAHPERNVRCTLYLMCPSDARSHELRGVDTVLETDSLH